VNWKMKAIPKMQTSKVPSILEKKISLIQTFQFQSIWGQMPMLNPIFFTSNVLSMLQTHFFHIRGVK
jgi:hypothetical protein